MTAAGKNLKSLAHVILEIWAKVYPDHPSKVFQQMQWNFATYMARGSLYTRHLCKICGPAHWAQWPLNRLNKAVVNVSMEKNEKISVSKPQWYTELKKDLATFLWTAGNSSVSWTPNLTTRLTSSSHNSISTVVSRANTHSRISAQVLVFWLHEWRAPTPG